MHNTGTLLFIMRIFNAMLTFDTSVCVCVSLVVVGRGWGSARWTGSNKKQGSGGVGVSVV